MAVLVKIIILLFSFIIGLNHVDYGNGICSVISFSLCLYLFLNLRKQYKYYIEDNWHYSLTNNYSFKNKFWDDSWFDSKSYKNNNYYYYNSTSANKETIKLLEKNIKKKKHNFVEFCDKPKILVNREEKDMIINNSNPKKPKLNLTNVLNKVESNEKRNNKLDGSEVIMINNNDKLDNIKTSVYEVIIKTLGKYKLSPNERYALLQSFYYIDICPMSVVIYIDKFILEKAHLNETHLHADELVDKIRDVLYCPNMDVTFVDLKCVNLLNFYLKK